MIDVSNDLERMRDYVGGQLSDEERRVFEERLVRDPNLVQELERSIRLKEGLHELEAQGRLAVLTPSPRLFLRWASLAAAATVAALALVLWRQPHLRGLEPVGPPVFATLAAASTPIAKQFTFVAMRGAATPELSTPRLGTIEFLTAPSAAAPTYRAVLTREQGGISSTIGTLSGLERAPDGYVHFYADAARLADGHYVLQVTPDLHDATPSSFPFNLRIVG